MICIRIKSYVKYFIYHPEFLGGIIWRKIGSEGFKGIIIPLVWKGQLNQEKIRLKNLDFHTGLKFKRKELAFKGKLGLFLFLISTLTDFQKGFIIYLIWGS